MHTRLILGLSLIAALLIGCASGGGTQPASTSPAASPTPATTDAGAPATAIDQAFIDMMVPHHQSAVEMAELALERAEHEELRPFAEEIIAAQESEISELKDLRLEWFGSADTPPMDAMPLMPGMEMPDMGDDMGDDATMDMDDDATMDMTTDIEMLRTADPFDEAFLEAMMPHHQSAIEASQIVLAETQRPEIRSLAEEIIASQQAEIDQMEMWLASWYPDAS